MFTFVGGPYTAGVTKISAATMNYIRSTMAGQAWDIIGGGTYTPTTKTIVDGAIGLQTNFSAVGLQINGLGGLHVLTGSTAYIDAGGAFVNNGTQTLNGATVYNAGVTFNSTVTVGAAGAITVNAASTTTLNGPLAQVGAATFSSTAVFNGAASIGAAGSFATNAAATSTFNGPIAVNLTTTYAAAATIVLSPARTATRVQPLPRVNTTTLAVSYRSLALAVSDIADQGLLVDVGQTITAISGSIDCSVGGAMPATRAAIALYRATISGAVLVEALEDPLLVLGTYRTVHTLTLTLATPYVALPTETYFVTLIGESGANSQAIAWLGSNMAASKASINMDG